MFITVKRHEREKRELIAASNRITEALLQHLDQGVFLLSGKDRILPQVSRSLGTLFRRQDFTNLTFEKLLAPLVSAKTLTVVRGHIAALLGGALRESKAETDPLENVDVRLTNADGSFEAAHYSFEFDPVEISGEPTVWLVRVTDITVRAQAARELEDLRAQVQSQGELLRGVLQMGGTRFAAFLQKADAAMKNINTVLKKPAREQDTFRNKLEETLEEVDRIRRDAAAFKLTGLETSARRFEDALHELRSRSTLSGSDFLPLAVKLDHLYGQFATIKSLALSAGSAGVEQDAAAPDLRMTDNGTQVIEAPRFAAEVARPAAHAAHRRAPAGSLDSALQALTEHVAEEQNKKVVLESHGLRLVPAQYRAAVKNVAVQFIRNAVMHGIEPAAVRASAKKAPHGTLRLEFKELDDRYELLFEDDGRGLDPDQVRATAIERGVVTGEAAARLRDREAIKLIFKSRYTTLAASPEDGTHGAGMSLVRRYIHEAGGKIALASLAGHETRFKVTLPLLAAAEPEPAGTELSLTPTDSRVA